MRLLFIHIFVLMSALVFAQRLTGFNLIPAGTTIAVRFTISQGVQCNGYTIYHSTDSVNFKIVSDNPGVCGSTAEDQTVSFTHQSPAVNSLNYYKVALFPVETSKIFGIYLAAQNQNGISVYPNPFNERDGQLSIRFPANKPVMLNGFIYNQSGEQCRSLKINTVNQDDGIALSDLRNGLYLIRLSDGVKTFSAKFVILR